MMDAEEGAWLAAQEKQNAQGGQVHLSSTAAPGRRLNDGYAATAANEVEKYYAGEQCNGFE